MGVIVEKVLLLNTEVAFDLRIPRNPTYASVSATVTYMPVPWSGMKKNYSCRTAIAEYGDTYTTLDST